MLPPSPSSIPLSFRSCCAALLCAGALLLSTRADAQVQPSNERVDSTDYTFNAEYRARSIRIEPLDLSGLDPAAVNWTEQRLRIDSSLIATKIGNQAATLVKADKVNIKQQVDKNKKPATPKK